MASQPYIGITGFTNQNQIAQIIQRYTPSTHRLMAGVLLSDKTWRGMSNKYPHRYPVPPFISSIWHPDVYNTLHYCTEDPALPQLREIITTCHVLPGMGIQFNVPWPAPAQIRMAQLMGIDVILQIGTRALTAANWDVDTMMERLDAYDPQYVLFDLSGGKGIDIEPIGLLRYMEMLMRLRPEIGQVVAGGLGAETVDTIVPLLAIERLSVDAESRLRDSADGFVLDNCVSYLNAARRVLGSQCAR